MGKIKNKQSELFKGINVDKIEKVMLVYRSWCNSKIQSMEDEFCGLMNELISSSSKSVSFNINSFINPQNSSSIL